MCACVNTVNDPAGDCKRCVQRPSQTFKELRRKKTVYTNPLYHTERQTVEQYRSMMRVDKES